jgi:heme exporter protein A
VCWNGENIRHCRDEYHASLLYLGHQPGVKATLTPLRISPSTRSSMVL